jgi:hypothetical protein
MFRAAYRSSSGALTLFAASGLHTHVVTGRSQVRVGIILWIIYNGIILWIRYIMYRDYVFIDVSYGAPTYRREVICGSN